LKNCALSKGSIVENVQNDISDSVLALKWVPVLQFVLVTVVVLDLRLTVILIDGDINLLTFPVTVPLA
jgi:hypothetical protein